MKGYAIRPIWMVAGAVLLVATLITACFGPAAPKNGTTQPTGAKVEGTATVPPGTSTGDSAGQSFLNPIARLFFLSAQAGVVHSPFPQAAVQAYNFANGNPVGQSGTTDDDGKYTLSNIPEGIDIVVFVTKGNVRLSALVPDVGTHDDVDVDAASTLAAQAFSGRYNKSRQLNAAEVAMARNAAQNYIVAHFAAEEATMDLQVGGTFIPQEFEAPLPEDVSKHIPVGDDDADPQVLLAKEIAHDLRNAMISIEGTVEAQAVKQEQHIVEVVAPYFEAVGEAAFLVQRALPHVLVHEPGTFDEKADSENGGFTYERRDEGTDSADPPQWVVHMIDGTVVTYTAEGLDMFLPSNGDESNQALDSNAGAYLEFAAAGDGVDHSGRIEIVGLDDLLGSLDVQAMAEEMETGIQLDADFSNPTIDQLGGSASVSATASAALRTESQSGMTSQFLEEEDLEGLLTIFESISLTGLFSSDVTTMSGSLSFDLALKDAGDVSASFLDEIADLPIYVSKIDFSGSLGTSQMELTGSLEAALVLHQTGISVPESLTVTGSFSDQGNPKTEFEGTLQVEITNAATLEFDSEAEGISEAAFPAGTLTFNGSVQGVKGGTKKPKISAEIVATSSWPTVSTEVTYTHGTNFLEGEVVFDIEQETITVELTNQDDLTVAFTGSNINDEDNWDIDGTIEAADDTELATIKRVEDWPVIQYADGTFESLN